MLSKYDYTIEYKKTSHHGNADVLNRLPNGSDVQFDKGEIGADYDIMNFKSCSIITKKLL